MGRQLYQVSALHRKRPRCNSEKRLGGGGAWNGAFQIIINSTFSEKRSPNIILRQ